MTKIRFCQKSLKPDHIPHLAKLLILKFKYKVKKQFFSNKVVVYIKRSAWNHKWSGAYLIYTTTIFEQIIFLHSYVTFKVNALIGKIFFFDTHWNFSYSLTQCCGSGSGSGRIRSFWVTRIRILENTRSRSGSFIHKKTPVIQIFSLNKIV